MAKEQMVKKSLHQKEEIVEIQITAHCHSSKLWMNITSLNKGVTTKRLGSMMSNTKMKYKFCSLLNDLISE